jgi:hypothetical protein
LSAGPLAEVVALRPEREASAEHQAREARASVRMMLLDGARAAAASGDEEAYERHLKALAAYDGRGWA